MNRKQRRALLSVRRQRTLTRRQQRQAADLWRALHLEEQTKDVPFLRTPLSQLSNKLLRLIAMEEPEEVEDFDLLE